jgi:hypothetical protein
MVKRQAWTDGRSRSVQVGYKSPSFGLRRNFDCGIPDNSLMSAASKPHLVIPFARCSGDAWLQAMQVHPGRLNTLGKLLRGMQLEKTDPGKADSLSPPHERVLALAAGLTAGTNAVDGLIPWAAQRAAGGGHPEAAKKAWAFITLCHWSMGREHATMTDPAALQLSPADSGALLDAMQPYFETESITLHHLAPGSWLAEGELFRGLPSASLDRVLGRNVDPWLPGAGLAGQSRSRPEASPATTGDAEKPDERAAAGTLRRLQNEMQMLLYTHPLNEERSAKGAPPVNSFWLSGTGGLEQARLSSGDRAGELLAPRSLALPAFNADWDGYMRAWDQLEKGEIAKFLSLQKTGKPVRLTLCGECNAHTFVSSGRNLLARVSSLLRRQPALSVLTQL